MHSIADYDTLRADLDITVEVLDDTQARGLFVRSEQRYPSNTTARDAYARVLVIRQLMAGAAKRVDYDQGESSEKLSQIMSNLKTLLKVWQDAEKDAVETQARVTAAGGIRFGSPKVSPRRIEEYPSE